MLQVSTDSSNEAQKKKIEEILGLALSSASESFFLIERNFVRVGLLNATVSSAESSTRVVTFPSQTIHRLLATIWILWIPV